MKTIHLLLGCAERRVSSVVEAAVLDVCYDRAAVQTTRALSLCQFVRTGSLGSHDLLILAADCLVADAGQKEKLSPGESLAAVHTLKARRSTPLIVLSAKSEMHHRFDTSGADRVLPEFFKPEQLKNAVRDLLRLPEVAAAEEARTWSWLASFARGFQRLKRA